MRKRIFEIIEASSGEDLASTIYDIFMIIVIIVSLIPLAFKEMTLLFHVVDMATVAVFIIDYILRFITADYKFNNHSVKSFIRYPFSFMAIIDLISILPSIGSGLPVFRVLKIVRLMRALRVFRVAKAMRYSKSMVLILDVLKESRSALAAVGTLALVYILVSALIVFNVEPDTFGNFFDALYWATVSLTTVGYGDIYPITMIGKTISMISSLFGIAVVALPSGIITAGYMSKLEESLK